MTAWHVPLAARKRLSWTDVRLIARHSFRAAENWRSSGAREHYLEWMSSRAELSHALRIWGAYRDWYARR